MNKKRILILVVLATSVVGLYFFFSDAYRKKPATPAREYVSNYIIDKKKQIRLEETSISKDIQSHVKVSPKSKSTENNKPQKKDDIAVDDNPEEEDDMNGDPVNHNMAEYFRFLQNNIGEGTSPSERTESILQHLLSSLPRNKAEEVFDLYEKFTRFEEDAAQKANEWSMPESADETLELIMKMRDYQQEYFGEETANLLFGADMKVMEYNARRAGILNDPITPGLQKEELLEQLAIDMWGEKEYQAMNNNKDPYDILDEKLLIYSDDLASMDPDTREKKIKEFRAIYLPQGY